MINYISKNQGNLWRGSMKELAAMRQEFNANASRMSQYERDTISKNIKERTEAQSNYIMDSAISEHTAAISRYEAARDQAAAADAAERKKFDVVRQNAERQNTHAAAGAALANANPLGGRSQAAGLQAIYQDAVNSGDSYKQRAAYEVFSLITDKVTDPTGRAQVSGMTHSLEATLQASRISPDMLAAATNQAEALANLAKIHSGLPEVAAAIGEPINIVWGGGSIDRAMRRVIFTRDGSGADIFADDSVEVTGIDFSKIAG